MSNLWRNENNSHLSGILKYISLEEVEARRILTLPGLSSKLAQRLGQKVFKLAGPQKIQGLMVTVSVGRRQLLICIEPRSSGLLLAVCGQKSESLRQYFAEQVVSAVVADWGAPWTGWRILETAYPCEAVSFGGWEFGGCRVWLVSADVGTVSEFRQMFRLDSDVNGWRTLCFRIAGRISLASRQWTLAEASSLRVGDVILTALNYASHDAGTQLQVRFGSAVVAYFEARLNMEKMTVKILSQEPQMEDEPISPPAGGKLRLADIQLPVSMELETARVSLAELGRLNIGDVLRIPAQPDNATVRLVCYGQVLGWGRLIVLDGCLAVSLESVEAVRLSETADA